MEGPLTDTGDWLRVFGSDDDEAWVMIGADQRPHVEPFYRLHVGGRSCRAERLQEAFQASLRPLRRAGLFIDRQALTLETTSDGTGRLVLLVRITIATGGIALSAHMVGLHERMREHVDDSEEPAASMTMHIEGILRKKKIEDF